jgi:hypothetical protein
MATTPVGPVGLLGAPPEAHSQLAGKVARLEQQVAELVATAKY